MTAATRVLRRTGVLAVLLLGLAMGTATPASAHPTLLFTDPATDAAVPESPPVITLVFNEAVTIGPRAVTVLDGEGRSLPVGDAALGRDGHAVTARPAGSLSPGTYVVRWRVTGSDGDQVEEEFRFAVGTAPSGAGTTGGASISWLDAALRWLLFAGLTVALGGVVGERFTASARAENPRLRPLRSWVAPATVLGLAGVAGLAGALVADTGTASSLFQDRVGRLLLAEAVGLVVALAVAAGWGGRWRAWSVLPLSAVVVAEGLRSHANVPAPGWGALLTGVHLAAVAVWIGALVQVVRAVLAWRAVRAAVLWVLAGYVRLALWVFVIVAGTGAVIALLLVPLPTVLTTTYGQVLLIKVALVAVAAGLALFARWTVRRERLEGLRTLIRAESVVLVGVLAVSAVLVSTPPAGGQVPGPPPPSGPVVPLGTLAGQIGVSAQASDGQLVVRLTTPRRGDYYAAQPPQDYTLSGQLTARHDSRAVEFRGCGEGCFVAPVGWRDGDNVLTLRPEAPGWPGGTVSLLIPWPPQPAAEELARAAAALREVGQLTVYEAVTSDTTTDLPTPRRQLNLTGAFFVSQEPFAAGTAPIAVRISRPDQPVRLALGYPAVFTNVQLTLDGRGRISEETLTDDSHLVHRRFVYPDD